MVTPNTASKEIITPLTRPIFMVITLNVDWIFYDIHAKSKVSVKTLRWIP